MATARTAISRAVDFWRRFGRPEAFIKTVRRMPRALALRVMRLANLRSVPDSFSAIAVATSLADFVTSA